MNESIPDDLKALESIFLELEDELAEIETVTSQSIQEVRRETQRAQIQERLRRLGELHAPWLHLGKSQWRWLTVPLNLLILPWGRKQAAFNREVQQALHDLSTLAQENITSAEQITRLEWRMSRLESCLRTLIEERE